LKVDKLLLVVVKGVALVNDSCCF